MLKPMNPEAQTHARKDIAQITVRRVQNDTSASVRDAVAVEEPLEIRVARLVSGAEITQRLAVTMRTPGHDAELAVGFLVGEGMLRERAGLREVGPCRGAQANPGNVVRVALAEGEGRAIEESQRRFYTTSSCGVCGKGSIEALAVHIASAGDVPHFDADALARLPDLLRQRQPGFEATGGMHGAALANADGDLLCVREDIGRHNAVDKLIGWAFMEGRLPLSSAALVLSGRASFELIQKALVAGIRCVVAVGAPSSLAVELAARHDCALLGFVREDRWNVYAGENRLHLSRTSP